VPEEIPDDDVMEVGIAPNVSVEQPFPSRDDRVVMVTAFDDDGDPVKLAMNAATARNVGQNMITAAAEARMSERNDASQDYEVTD